MAVRITTRPASWALVGGLILFCVGVPARADDEGEWANIGVNVADVVADNLLSWIEAPLDQRGLTISDDPGFDPPDPDTPVIVIRLFVDAPAPASNKTIIIKIYPDGRVEVTTIHHTLFGDQTEVETRTGLITDDAKRWLWGDPEEHDLTDDVIDIWTPSAAEKEIEQRVQQIVKARVFRNILASGLALLALLSALRQLLGLLSFFTP